MKFLPTKQIHLEELDALYDLYLREGICFPSYCVPVGSYVEAEGDIRLHNLKFDSSPASIRLWNFLLSENRRLHTARAQGFKIVGTMKDLGTVPILAYAYPNTIAFYPDGTWWTPCVMELSDRLFCLADEHGIGPHLCPVRAMYSAFINKEHFPIPDQIICSTGAVCDDFSAISQRLFHLGYPLRWWEIPPRRPPDPDETKVELPNGTTIPKTHLDFVTHQFHMIAKWIEELHPGIHLTKPALQKSIHRANHVRRLINAIRDITFSAPVPPIPALEELIAEMLVIHFCSDPSECCEVLEALLQTVKARVEAGVTPLDPIPKVRVAVINPPADLRMMNLIEECGLLVCATDYMFTHALIEIPEDMDPFQALATVALCDPMIGHPVDRARHIAKLIKKYQIQAVIVFRIPGASHSAWEGEVIQRFFQESYGIPVLVVEVPTIIDPVEPTLKTQLEALYEIIQT